MTIPYPEQPSQPSAAPEKPQPSQQSWWGKMPKRGKIALIVGGIVAVLVVLAVQAVIAMTNVPTSITISPADSTSQTQVVQAPAPPVTATPGPVTPSPIVIPPGQKLPSTFIELPDVKDMRASDVSDLLRQVGLTKITFVSSRTSEVPRELQNVAELGRGLHLPRAGVDGHPGHHDHRVRAQAGRLENRRAELR